MATGTVNSVDIPEILVIPRYSFAEADRLARVTSGTSKRWTRGYTYESGEGRLVRKPPVGRAELSVESAVSFADLVEVAAICGLRKLGFSLPQIRKIVDGCQDIFDSERPLLSHAFKVDGRDAFVEKEKGVLVSVLRGKRRTAWDDVLEPFLETVDYQDGWAHRWWPGGRSSQVIIDPKFGYGLPVVQGTGVRTEILTERSEVGDSMTQIADDFGVPVQLVQDALQFERSLVA